MGLKDGYGVLLGTLVGYKRDDPNDFGRFMHGVLTVAAPAGRYQCAVDVDTRNGAIPVHWRIQPLRSAEWAATFTLPDGWHPLGSSPDSGAVDYIRDPRLHELMFIPNYVAKPLRFPFPAEEWAGLRLPHQSPIPRTYGSADWRGSTQIASAKSGDGGDLRRKPIGPVSRITSAVLKLADVAGSVVSLQTAWNEGSSAQALTDLEAVIASPQRIVVFGAPFHVGRGVHDIHQNQGDPIGGGHDVENATWQDGITIAIRSDGTASAFMNKFGTQADATDNNGHPISP